MTKYKELIQARNACADDMDDDDKNYLLRVDDAQQYPAARCAMGENVIMYGRSSSQCVEAMNAANRAIRDRTSVCVTNAVMLLMKLESKRYDKMRDAVWKHIEGGAVLTPRGRELADEVAKDVPRPRDYIISMNEEETMRVFQVRGNHATSKTQIVRLKRYQNGDSMHTIATVV